MTEVGGRIRAPWTSLQVVRFVVFGGAALLVGLASTELAASAPPSWFDPPGLLALLPEAFWSWFLQESVLQAARIVLPVLLLASSVLPQAPRVLDLVGVAGLFLLHGTAGGFGGYMNHALIVPLHVVLILAVAPRRPESEADVLRLAALVLGTAYMVIGLHRIFIGGLGIFTGTALETYLYLRTFEPGNFAFEVSYWLLQWPGARPLLNAGFFVVTVAEILSPIAVFRRRVRWAWLAVMVPFHFSTLFLMNIFFWENLILIALLFTPLPEWIAARWNDLRHPRSQASAPAT